MLSLYIRMYGIHGHCYMYAQKIIHTSMMYVHSTGVNKKFMSCHTEYWMLEYRMLRYMQDVRIQDVTIQDVRIHAGC